MINHLFLYKGWGSLLILSFTSSTDKWNAALVILAIALFSRSWFSLFRILPQTASWYKTEGSRPRAYFDWRVADWHLHVPMVSALFSQVVNRNQLAPLGLVEVLN